MASLAASVEVPPKQAVPVTFLHHVAFPESPDVDAQEQRPGPDRQLLHDRVQGRLGRCGEGRAAAWRAWRRRPSASSRAFCDSDLPEAVKEAALFNLSTLRTQTCFRTEDGRFYGFEGCGNQGGCCHGSCTHVWNYEQATAFLFGGLAKIDAGDRVRRRPRTMTGLMSFRVNLPLERAP